MGRFKSLRDYVRFLKKRGELLEYDEPVDVRYELSAVTKRYDGEKTILFKNVRGYSIPVLTNLFCKRDRFSDVLQVPTELVVETIVERAKKPIETELVDSGPVKDRVYRGGFDLQDMLPIPTHHEKDAGPYITSGVIIAKDPDTGVRNASYARMQVKGPRKLGIMINRWRHLWQLYTKAERRGEPLEVAIVIGGPPELIIEGAMPGNLVPITQDELDTAGGLVGRPLKVVECETVDLEVPAHSEIVLEGRIPPGVREEEGPFGDYSMVYDGIVRRRLEPVIELTCLSMRENPIYHDILPASMDHWILGGVPREAELLDTVRRVNPNVLKVHLTPGGCCRFHAVVQIRKVCEADGKTTIVAAYSPTETARDVKLVVVVDEDIDPFNLAEVEWALATRVQYDRDIVVLRDQPGSLDPSAIASTPEPVLMGEGGTEKVILCAKLGVDATRTFRNPKLLPLFERIKVAGGDVFGRSEDSRNPPRA